MAAPRSSPGWQPVARVISFDNRGTGRSDKPTDGYEFGQHGEQTSSACWTICVFGASICSAFRWAERSRRRLPFATPDRIDRLVLFGTFCGGVWAEPASLSVFKRLLVTENQSPEEAARQAWPVTYSPDYLAANAEAVEQQMRRELEHPTPMFVAQRQMEALRKFDSYRDLPRIRAPTLGRDRRARRSGETAELQDPGFAHSRCAAGTAG